MNTTLNYKNMLIKKLKNETVVSTVDPETGEQIEVTTSKTFSIHVEQDEFYMTYYKYLSGLFQLTSAKEILLMVKLTMLAEYNTGNIFLTPERRKTLCLELGIDKTYLSNCLKNLKTKKLLLGERNDLKINPLVYWKGSNKERNKYLREDGLRLQIEFKQDDE